HRELALRQFSAKALKSFRVKEPACWPEEFVSQWNYSAEVCRCGTPSYERDFINRLNELLRYAKWQDKWQVACE
ncbi:MAG: hypothetical protein ABSG16_06280, partial [Candidatus Acidiferrum sp.]